MRDRLKQLIIYRLILISIFLLMGLFFQLKGVSIFWAPYSLFHFFVALLYVTTIIFAVITRKKDNLVSFTYGLFVSDVIVVTGIVYVTGGGLSLFFPIYVLVAMEAGAILERQGGLMAASLSSIAYGILLNLEYHWIIPFLAPRYPYHSFYLLYKLLIAIIIFYLAGYLTGYLTEEVRARARELTQTREDYSRLEAFNRNVIQSIQSGLMTCDLEQRVTFLNPTGEQILGMKAAQLRKKRLPDLFPAMAKGSDQKQKPRMETTYVKPDGAEIVVGLTSSPLKDHNGEEVGKIIAFRDLTRIREMEESVRRAEKLATIGQLAAGMAHEIRNPLASISGAIQLLKEEKQASEHHKRLMDIIITESNRLNGLITDFLLYAQPPALNKKIVDISALIDDTLEVFSRSPQCTRGVEIVKNTQKKSTLSCDSQQLQQVLWNLLINAVSAMDGKGLLEVTTSQDERSQKLSLSVRDTGQGIPASDIKKIFDPFFTTKEGGTGLGLSIVHKIVESHGGDIRVESEPGHGTTFTLTFPTS